MGDGLESLPDDIETLKAALMVARAQAAAARARQSDDQALIAHLKLQIEKLNRDRYGPRSERSARLLDQLELTLEELESSATEDELAAEMAAAKTTKVASFTRKRPSRQPFPEHLPRERVIVPGPVACACCGGSRLSRLGEDITETLEVVPKSWKVIQQVREKFTCRDCEKISQAPAPFHVLARGWAGPSLLAMVLFEKFGQHQPLNRQAERYAREGVPISLSTLADQVGGCTAALAPLFKRLEAYVLSAERLHGDDTTVPVLAKGKTDTGRIWVYVRDDKPFGGQAPPGAVFYYSRDRAGAHPQAHLASYSGIFQADAYGGYGKLYDPGRNAGPILEAACWVHARRPFFVTVEAPSGPSSDIERLISSLKEKPGSGLIFLPDAFTWVQRAHLTALIEQYGLPAIYPLRGYVEAGGLMSYGIDLNKIFVAAANYIDQILRGANPAELPVQAPTEFELVVNQRTARQVGLQLSSTLLARADEVIEERH